MSRKVVVSLSILGVLFVLAAVVDRVAVHIAQDRVAARLAEHQPFTRKPTVRIYGLPFLTQAIRGKYQEIEVSGDGLTVGKVQDASFDARLHEAHAPLGEVLNHSLQQLPVDRATGTLTIPYSEIVRLSSVPGLTIKRHGNELRIQATVSLAGLASTTAEGTVTPSLEDGQLALRFTIDKVAGMSLGNSQLGALATGLNVKIPLPSLPYQLKLTGIRATDHGVQVAGEAHNIVLSTSD